LYQISLSPPPFEALGLFSIAAERVIPHIETKMVRITVLRTLLKTSSLRTTIGRKVGHFSGIKIECFTSSSKASLELKGVLLTFTYLYIQG